MQTLYSAGIFTYIFLIRLVSFLGGHKARLWVTGRKLWAQKISQDLKGNTALIVWIHAASVGEFEQGRPIIEYLKLHYPKYKIILTFFSPSGYELHKNYSLVDHVYYLPSDTPANAKKFVSIVKPKLAVFVKYEFWYNYIFALNLHHIPFCYISAKFRPNQVFFKKYGAWFLSKIKSAAGFFVQDEASEKLLRSYGISNVWKVGDTRFDRVLQIRKDCQPLSIFDQFCEGARVVVAGSTWPKDEEILADLVPEFPSLKWIIVPHEIAPAHIDKIRAQLEKFNVLSYSAIKEGRGQDLRNAQVLIVDTMGLLSKLYQYADVAYVGGGFGVGIHNVLEAAVYGVPVFFGPRYQKFKEAVDLLQLGGAFTISGARDFRAYLNTYAQDWKEGVKAGQIAKEYVGKGEGAVSKILNQWVGESWI